MLVEPGSSLAGLFLFCLFFLCFFFAFYSKAGSDNTEPLQPVPLWAICDQRSDAD